jgi:hypothetical protein
MTHGMLFEKIKALPLLLGHQLKISGESNKTAERITHRTPMFVVLDEDFQSLELMLRHTAHSNYDPITLVHANAMHETVIWGE